ncbi:hypothetical protein [Natrinema salsiterrestre]|uniref:hypothetical protein n=1 Tax=Natrinema salsiterrestre TaxID=2950540 RepID=UPI002406F527|nr:hypothetical protein [Natrinema salsiterrestre]
MSVRESGDTVIVQATSQCATAEIGRIENGEVEKRSTHVHSFCLHRNGGVIVLYYDFEKLDIVTVAEHLDIVATHFGVDARDVPSSTVRPHRQGGGLALPLSATYVEGHGRLVDTTDNVRVNAVPALVIAHNDEGTGEAVKYALEHPPLGGDDQ